MAPISALLALCAGNSPVTGEFPLQRPVTRSFDVSFDLRLNKRLSKQSRRWWFETPLWRNCNVFYMLWLWYYRTYCESCVIVKVFLNRSFTENQGFTGVRLMKPTAVGFVSLTTAKVCHVVNFVYADDPVCCHDDGQTTTSRADESNISFCVTDYDVTYMHW